jgi:hypothetical protein
MMPSVSFNLVSAYSKVEVFQLIIPELRNISHFPLIGIILVVKLPMASASSKVRVFELIRFELPNILSLPLIQMILTDNCTMGTVCLFQGWLRRTD